MNNVKCELEVRKNVRTGKNDIFIIYKYSDLEESEAKKLASKFNSSIKPKEFDIPESIELFMNEVYDGDIENLTVKSVYEDYISYCEENNYEPINNLTFGKIVCSKYGYQSKVKFYKNQRERVRIYIKN